MATNYRGKSGKSADLPSFVALAFQNRVDYGNSDFMTTSCKNLVIFGPVTKAFKTGKDQWWENHKSLLQKLPIFKNVYIIWSNLNEIALCIRYL